jgi:sulfatase maturation enzyme AslB (radical SAM superfamily)
MIPIRKIFAKKNLQGHYCLSPFVMADIMLNGDVRLCGCASWMPQVIGNLLTTSMNEIMSSPLASDVRKSIISGTYEYCNENACGIMKNNGLNTAENLPLNVARLIADPTAWDMPYEICFSGDLTCNLSCPSCRTEVIKPSQEETHLYEQLGKQLADNLFAQPTQQRINLIVSTSGEIFASPMLLSFVNSIDLEKFPNVFLNLQTNGLLAPRRWKRLGLMQDRVTKTTMTLDAARPDTYGIVRRGGRWCEALEALKFLQLQRENGMKFHVRMVVQDRNWREILEFYVLAKKYHADVVEYVRLVDWGTWSEREFQQHDVFHNDHANRTQAKMLMDKVRYYSDVYIAGDFGDISQ